MHGQHQTTWGTEENYIAPDAQGIATVVRSLGVLHDWSVFM